MSKAVNLDTLGMKRERMRVFQPVADPVTGLKQFQWTSEIRDVPNNVLTLEDAQTLKEEDWKKRGDMFMCIAGGHRFFCKENPTGRK